MYLVLHCLEQCTLWPEPALGLARSSPGVVDLTVETDGTSLYLIKIKALADGFKRITIRMMVLKTLRKQHKSFCFIVF